MKEPVSDERSEEASRLAPGKSKTQGVSAAHLEKPLDDLSEEVREGCCISQGGICRNGGAIAVAFLAVSADEGVEQQRQPVLGKVSQHLSVPADSQTPSSQDKQHHVQDAGCNHMYSISGVSVESGTSACMLSNILQFVWVCQGKVPRKMGSKKRVASRYQHEMPKKSLITQHTANLILCSHSLRNVASSRWTHHNQQIQAAASCQDAKP